MSWSDVDNEITEPVREAIVKWNEGLRYDQGKLPFHLLPPEMETGVAAVLQKGAVKYAERNWELGMNYSRVYSSLRRHLNAWWSGEENDPETGLPHVDHIATNVAFLQAYTKRGIGTDDRPSKLAN
jgi:hypothetical protein